MTELRSLSVHKWWWLFHSQGREI